jgi:ABC-type bacteriocin/lantibiotic exporter with double-glycine peptidase domain
VYNYDCGANAMQSILTYYGYDLREEEIMERAGTTEKAGSSPSGLKKVADHFNIPYEEGIYSVDDLKIHIDNKYPTLIPIQAWPENPKDIDYESEWEEGHWVIAIGWSATGIIFEDPSSVKRTFISYEDLPKRWHDIGDEGKELIHYGIVFKGIPKYKYNDIIVMENKYEV